MSKFNSMVNNPVNIISTFLWIGFVCAISFMEAWLKFQAPGVTLAVGLGIGQLVFALLNKVEWVFASTVLITLIIGRLWLFNWQNIFFLGALLILIIQTFWLLPVLDARADSIILSQDIEPSNIHFYYVGVEVLKVIFLSVYGIKQFKQ